MTPASVPEGENLKINDILFYRLMWQRWHRKEHRTITLLGRPQPASPGIAHSSKGVLDLHNPPLRTIQMQMSQSGLSSSLSWASCIWPYLHSISSQLFMHTFHDTFAIVIRRAPVAVKPEYDPSTILWWSSLPRTTLFHLISSSHCLPRHVAMSLSVGGQSHLQSRTCTAYCLSSGSLFVCNKLERVIANLLP